MFDRKKYLNLILVSCFIVIAPFSCTQGEGPKQDCPGGHCSEKEDSDGQPYGDGFDCPNDPLKGDPGKTKPGICGCGTSDKDSDGDGTPNCNDNCKNDPKKTAPGLCGCGTPDKDTDGDRTLNCFDGCPRDPKKIEPGICGCGKVDIDSDGDGTADCNDTCQADPQKIKPGFCGCGATEKSCRQTVTLSVDDAMVDSSLPNRNFNTTTMSIDEYNNPGLTYVLIKPLDVDSIPQNATVYSAILVVRVFDSGNTVSIRKLLGSWNETRVSYNSAPGRSGQITTMSGNTGSHSINIKSLFQNWLDGAEANGLALYPTGSDGVDIYSSEYSTPSVRPKFIIEYYE